MTNLLINGQQCNTNLKMVLEVPLTIEIEQRYFSGLNTTENLFLVCKTAVKTYLDKKSVRNNSNNDYYESSMI